MFSPNDLYKMTPADVSRNPEDIAEFIYESGIDDCSLGVKWDYEDPRVEIKVIKDVYIDGERTYTLSTVWFDDKPVMVVQKAGRGGRDHNARFITDKKLFIELCEYVRSLSNIYEKFQGDVYDADTVNSDLTFFYGGNIMDEK